MKKKRLLLIGVLIVALVIGFATAIHFGAISPGPIPSPILSSYTLKIIIIGNGTSDPSAGDHVYPAGSSVSLIATPSKGWTFSAWNNTESNSTNPTTVSMTSNKTITLYLSAPYQAYGLDFSPFTQTGQDPSYGTIISENQIRNLLTTVKPYTQWIRTYGCTHGLEKVGVIANEMNINVAAQAWLSSDTTANQQEIANLISVGKAGNADILIVGSEVLLRGDLTESQLIDYMHTVKKAVPEIPVTTADTDTELLRHPAVMNACDLIMPNIYPFWQGVNVDEALFHLNITYQQIIATSAGKTVIIAETGWPSAGNKIGNAIPSPENARYFFMTFVSWAKSSNVSFMYFEAFDEPWKTNEGAVGVHWGIWDNNGSFKTNMDKIFNGQT